MQEAKVFTKGKTAAKRLSLEEGLSALQGAFSGAVIADVFLSWKVYTPPKNLSNFKQVLDALESSDDSVQRKSYLARIVEHAFLLFDIEEQIEAAEVAELFDRFDFYFKCNSKLVETLISHLHPKNLDDIPQKWFINPSVVKSYGLRGETSTAKLVGIINQAGFKIEDYALILLTRDDLDFSLVLQLLQTETEYRAETLMENRLLLEEELRSLPAKILLMGAKRKENMNPAWFEEGLGLPVYDSNVLTMSKMVKEYRQAVGDEFWSAFESSWEGTLDDLHNTYQEVGK